MPPKPNHRNKRMTEEERLSHEFLTQTSLGRSVRRTAEHLLVADRARAAPSNPDNPPCDGCKEPYAGTDQCSRCESVFYCGRECQVAHWRAQHKSECKDLMERNRETARRVLEQFKELQDWSDLDVAGAYKAAVKQGLHDKIREVLELEKSDLVNLQRPSDPITLGSTLRVMSVLFRGGRAEGNADAKSPSFDCVDGLRIKGYVKSHPAALDAWIQASVQWLRSCADRSLLRDKLLHREVSEVANDVWVGWAKVFTNSTAARAIFRAPILCGGDGEIEESADHGRKRGEAHARGVVNAFGEALRLVVDASDLRSVQKVEGFVSYVAAMVLLRTQEYGIGISVEGIFDLKGAKKFAFHNVSLPMAERMIEKGGLLTPQEATAVMALSCRRAGIR